MGKIHFPSFKSHVGLISDIGGALGFLSAIKAVFFSDWQTVWTFMLQLNWIVGMMAFYVLFGWLIVLVAFWESLDSVYLYIKERLFGSPQQPVYPRSSDDFLVSSPSRRYRGIKPLGFILFGVFALISFIAITISSKLEPQKGDKYGSAIIVWSYLALALVAGVYFALTVKPDTGTGLYSADFTDWLIRVLGWIALPLLIFLMFYLLVKMMKGLFSLVFTTEEPKK